MNPSILLSIADLAAKGAIILSAAACTAYCLRRRSAATVHRIWTVGFAALLAAPLAGTLLPQQVVRIAPRALTSAAPPTPGARPSGYEHAHNVGGARGPVRSILQPEFARGRTSEALRADDKEQPLAPSPAPAAAGESGSLDDPASRRDWSTGAIFVLTWAGVAGLLTFRLIWQQTLARIALRNSAPVNDGAWSALLTDACRQLRISRPVKLLRNIHATTPATAGAWRPVVLLPADADAWPPSRRQAVLLHELAHVKRGDVLTQLLAGLAAAGHWFNPLAWYGLAQMRKLRELACDDLVLAAGQPPADYAETLLAVARSYRPSHLAAAIGMARSTNVERRILAILDAAHNRLPLSRRGARLLVAAATAVVVLLGSVRLEPRQVAAGETQPERQAKAPESTTRAAEESPAPAATERPDGGERILEVLVTDESGRPLPGSRVFSSTWEVEGGPDYPSGSHDVDEHGIARIPQPRRLNILRLWPSYPGYVPEFLNFSEGSHEEGKLIPDKISFQLARGTKLSGQIVDETGQPIAGAKVEVRVEVREPAWGANPAAMIGTWLTSSGFSSPAPVTDADGRWSIDNAPAQSGEKDYEFRLKITHDDYARDSVWGQFQREQGITAPMLRAGTATIVLKRGVTVTGTVVDTAGSPVTKGLVIWSDRPYWAEGVNETEIDRQGRFTTIPLKPGEYPLTVAAPGYQPTQTKVRVEPGLKPLRFELAPGKKIVIKFVDHRGEPVPNVYVGIGGWRGAEAIYNEKHPNVPESGIPRHSDEHGVYAWDWAPEDAVAYRIGKKGYAGQTLSLVATDAPHVVTLFEERVATGLVTDAESGEPVPEFSAMPVIVFRDDFYHTRWVDAKVGRDGRYELPLTGSGNPDDRYRVRFEADGYRTLVTADSFGPQDGRATLNVALQPAAARTGRVVDAEGQPVDKAIVIAASSTDVPTISNDGPDHYDSHSFQTDSQGGFTMHASGESQLIRAIHARGFAQVRREPDEPIGTLQLQPWARVEGRLMQDGRPVSDQTVYFSPTPHGNLGQPRFQESYQVRSDYEGRFVFERLPPVLGCIRAHLGPWQESPLTSAESAPLDLQPGERRTVVLGGAGAAVTGKVVPTGRGDVPLDAHWSLNYLVSRDRGVALPAGFPPLSFEPTVDNPLEPSWLTDPNYVDWLATRTNYFVKLTPEGELRVSGVPAGVYDLVLQLYEQPAGCLVQTVGEKIVRVAVTDDDVTAGEKSLGEIEVPCRVGPRIGESMRAYSFLDASGRELHVADLSGRYVVMHVWASWCGPCLETMPDMQATAERLAEEPVTFAGLNVDADPQQARALAATRGWTWGHTYLGDDSDMARQLALSSVPAYFLIGPDGKLVASAGQWAEIKKQLESALASPQ